MKRKLYAWELKSYWGQRISLPKSIFFEEYFKIWFDNSNSNIEIGDGVFFRDYCSLLAHENGEIKIGKNVFFNHSCSINACGSVIIGDDCLFGENVRIYDHNHSYVQNELIRAQNLKTKPVVIGTNSWIGSNVTILKGVKIGNNCIIGANNLIFKDIPSNTILKLTTNTTLENLEENIQ